MYTELNSNIEHRNNPNKRIERQFNDPRGLDVFDPGVLSSDDDSDYSEVGRRLRALSHAKVEPSTKLRNISNSNSESLQGRSATSYVNYNRYHSELLKASAILCAILILISKLLVKLNFWIIFTIISELKRLCGVDNIMKVPFHMPQIIIKQLSSYVDYFRRFQLGQFNKIRPSTKSEKNDNIITQYTWSTWVLFGALLFLVYLSCIHSFLHASDAEKSRIGVHHFGHYFAVFGENIYNMPGHTCMIHNGCCPNKYATIKRWIYCMFSMPYRISFMGMEQRKMKRVISEKLLKNLNDWGIKRHLYKIQALHQEDRILIRRTKLRRDQFEASLSKLEYQVNRNLSKIETFKDVANRDERIYEDSIKMFDEIKNDMYELRILKLSVKKVATEALRSIRYAKNYGEHNIEKYFNIEHGNYEKMLRKIQNLVKFIDELTKWNTEFITKRYRNELEKLNNEIYQLTSQVEQLESNNQKTDIDLEYLKENTYNNLETEMLRFIHKNEELIIKYNNIARGVLTGVHELRDKQTKNISLRILKLMDSYSKNMSKCMVVLFLEQITEVVKLTVEGTLKLSNPCKPNSKVGLFNGPNDPKDCQETLIPNETYIPYDICPRRDVVAARIEAALRIYDSDQTGFADFALWGNGGRVVPELTQPNPLHIPIRFSTDEHSQWFNHWKELFVGMNQNTKLINSVFFLNHESVQPGHCWLFVGSNGSTVINLSRPVMVRMVAIDHIDTAISPIQNSSDAMKEFEIKALLNLTDTSDEISLGKFVFDDIDEDPQQQFEIENPIKVQFVKLVIHSNHGAEVTCVYRFRVHGDYIKL